MPMISHNAYFSHYHRYRQGSHAGLYEGIGRSRASTLCGHGPRGLARASRCEETGALLCPRTGQKRQPLMYENSLFQSLRYAQLSAPTSPLKGTSPSPCSPNGVHCPGGYSCYISPAGPGYSCLAPLGPGDLCGSTVNGFCPKLYPCQATSWNATLVCQSLLNNGDACGSPGQTCPQLYGCQNTSWNSTLACQTLLSPQAPCGGAGQTCPQDYPCQSASTGGQLLCQQLRVAPPASCSPPGIKCIENYWCRGSKCVTGQPCVSGSSCPSGTTCQNVGASPGPSSRCLPPQ